MTDELPVVHVCSWLRPVAVVLRGWLAIALGRHVWTWRPLSPAELAHELCHVQQWQRHGWCFALMYIAASWRAWRGGGHCYWDNVFEVEAREAEAGAPR